MGKRPVLWWGLRSSTHEVSPPDLHISTWAVEECPCGGSPCTLSFCPLPAPEIASLRAESAWRKPSLHPWLGIFHLSKFPVKKSLHCKKHAVSWDHFSFSRAIAFPLGKSDGRLMAGGCSRGALQGRRPCSLWPRVPPKGSLGNPGDFSRSQEPAEMPF